MTRAKEGPLSTGARTFGRGSKRVSAIAAHLSQQRSRVLPEARFLAHGPEVARADRRLCRDLHAPPGHHGRQRRAACGAAPSPLFLHLARGFQGIGGAVMFAVSLAILSQEFHGRERGTAFGIWGATVGAAVAIGPLVGGALTSYAGWRWIFFVNIPIGVACVAVGIRVLRETRDEEAGGFDVVGLLTLTGGLFAL